MDQPPNNAQDEHPLRVAYGYNDSQNDSFNSYLNPDTESTFNQPWNAQSFNPHVETSNPYESSGQNWSHNSLAAPSIQGVTNYGVPDGIYSHNYSRSPAAFEYPPFNSNRNPALSGAPYDHAFAYGPPSIQTHDQYGFPKGHSFQQNVQQTQSQTISPQALQNYPAGYQQNHAQRQLSVGIHSSIEYFIC